MPRPTLPPSLLSTLFSALLCALPAASCGTREPTRPSTSTRAYDASGRATRPVAARPGSPNVIVITLSGLRADAMPLELESGGDLPNLARLARKSVTFAQASSSAGSTLPALASLFSGRSPDRHGVRSDSLREPEYSALATLAEVLSSTLGYQTAAFLGRLPPALAAPLCAGFDQIHTAFELQQAPALLARWDAARAIARPFFLCLQADEAAHPQRHPQRHPEGPGTASAGPESARELWAGLESAPDPALVSSLAGSYRGDLRRVDDLLQQTLDLLRTRGLLENTLLVVTSDHGMALGEHGLLLHGGQLYDELLHVPLILSGPPPFDQHVEVAGSVGLTDLFPTLVTWLGAPLPDDLEGRSFLESLRAPGPGRPVRAEETRTHEQTGGRSVAQLVSLRTAAWKYIGTFDVTQGTLREEAYDLRSDPSETRNLAQADGLVRNLPFEEDLCHAIEGARDRLWGCAAYAQWTAQQGYSAGSYASVAGRPPSGCAASR